MIKQKDMRLLGFLVILIRFKTSDIWMAYLLSKEVGAIKAVHSLYDKLCKDIAKKYSREVLEYLVGDRRGLRRSQQKERA